MNQYGHSVQIQAQVEQATLSTSTDIILVDKSVDQPNTLTLYSLHSNPLDQRLVDGRAAVLENKLKMELSQSVQKHKKSERHNVSEITNPNLHLHWPDESCLIGMARKRSAYDDLCFGQSVVGFMQNILDVNHAEDANRMLGE